MPAIIKGQNAVYAGQRSRFIPGVGYTIADVWTFSNSSDAAAFANAQAQLGTVVVDFDNRVGSGYAVEVSNPSPDAGGGDEPVVDIYELPPLDEELDITESPAFRALSDANQKIINEYLAGDKSETSYNTALASVTGTAAADFLVMARNGTQRYISPTTEFRWTRVVSDAGLAAAAVAAFNSVGKNFQTDTLNSIVSPPTFWQNAITAAASGLGAPGSTIDYNSGWLKMQPAIVRRGLNRNEISLRWILNNWSVVLYGAAI